MGDISIVIPLLDERENLPELMASLQAVLSDLGREYEIVFVDDGSTDGSFAVLEQLCARNPRAMAIQFRRNFGKAAALSAGFAQAQGDVVITMDADLQDDPREIPRFLAELERDVDLVSGWKFPRLDPLSKTVPSQIFNLVTRLATGVNIHDFNCGFKAYRREVVAELQIYGELYRYIPALAHQQGFRVGEIKVQHHPRRFGSSKYGVARFARGFFDLITVLFLMRYNSRPLHIFGWLGLFSLLSGLIINLYLTVLWFMGERPIGDRPLLMLGVLLVILGAQFISLGLIAEMVNRGFAAQTKGYSIRKKIGK